MIDESRIVKVLDERIPASAFEAKVEPVLGSNLIDPTLDMIELVIRKHLIDGLSVQEIRKTVKTVAGKKMSLEQVRQIVDKADSYKAAKLEAVAVAK